MILFESDGKIIFFGSGEGLTQLGGTMRLSCSFWKADIRNTRQGFCSIKFDDIGLVLRDVVVHKFTNQEGTKWWLALPARQYTNRDGEQKFWAFALFDDRVSGDLFQAAGLAAVFARAPELRSDEVGEIQRAI